MKILLILALILPFTANATQQAPPQNAEKYRWLYEILFNDADRAAQPDESFKSFYVHLADSDKNFPKPELIEDRNLKPVKKIEGTITYVSVVKKKYIYDILKAEDGTLVLNVRVHLKDPAGDDIKNFTEKIKLAENIWNANRVPTDFKYIFKFDLVANKKDSHFSVSVLDSTRGPYDQKWSRAWTPTAIAHEIGHMLGLGDEYQTISGKSDCLETSLMCSSWKGSLMQHHYYFVLRRLVNAAAF